MEALDLYRIEVSKLPEFAEPEFRNLLQQYRAGDEGAGRAITGSYLGMVLGLVESLATLPSGLTFLDTVEEANAALVEALSSYSGTTADEFAGHVREAVHTWLNTLDAQQS